MRERGKLKYNRAIYFRREAVAGIYWYTFLFFIFWIKDGKCLISRAIVDSVGNFGDMHTE